MEFVIEHLNALGAQALSLAWPIFWQSSLLIALLLIADSILSRKVRPTVRYALWLIVLLKMILPPSLALPSAAAWWLRPQVHTARPVWNATALVSYGAATAPVPVQPAFLAARPEPRLSAEGAGLLGSVTVSLALFGFVLWRWRQLTRQALGEAGNAPPGHLSETLQQARASAGVSHPVRVRILRRPVSPALFGLLRPAILLPECLVQNLSAAQLRPVLLHELIHLRRGDAWVNCAQTLLQIVYWWQPLLWLANHRIRRAREEAVDEAVMLALRGDAETYAPTLLEVARLALPRPLASLGLVGILESPGALRQRIERLLQFRPPRRAGITLIAALCALGFGAVALPMGQAPDKPAKPAGEDSRRISPAEISGEVKTADVNTFVTDGKLLYQMGKLDEAEKKFILALKQDPRNQAAYYYMNLVKEARNKQTPRGRTNTLYTSSGRQRIYSKLDAERLASVQFDRVPLSEVAKRLVAESKHLDPAGSGINFILAHVAIPVDPVTGQPIVNQEAERQADTPDIAAVTIRLVPPLTNVRLADVLDAIVKTADQPIKYSIEDYAVVFSFKRNEPPPLYVRMIKLDPNTFVRALHSATGKPTTGDKHEPIKLLREFFASIGVDLSQPKSVFWNDGEGTLVVRATLQDLDTVETAVQVMSIAPPQLNIKARFIELPEAEEEAFWRKHDGADKDSSAARAIQLTQDEAQKQFQQWQSHGAELLNESSVTTLSGRQTQIQVVLGLTNLVTIASRGWESRTNVTTFPGPALDVLPTVSADALRCDLAMTLSASEFLGYDDPGQFVTQNGQGRSEPIPHFRLRQLPVTATVWDGNTLVLGGALLQGRLADKWGQHLQKRLLLMVTPTVIDPAGNRVHTAEEIHAARSKIGLWYPTIPPRPAK